MYYHVECQVSDSHKLCGENKLIIYIVILRRFIKYTLVSYSGCLPFGAGEIQGLFQDFQARPSFSKFKDLELGKIFENGTNLPHSTQ
jgi:hypothetical protein